MYNIFCTVHSVLYLPVYRYTFIWFTRHVISLKFTLLRYDLSIVSNKENTSQSIAVSESIISYCFTTSFFTLVSFRMDKITYVLLFSLLVLLFSPGSLCCPDLWVAVGDSCYKTSPDPMNWFQAEEVSPSFYKCELDR